MTEVRTEPVVATLCEDIDAVRGRAGAFEYYRYHDHFPAGIIYCCPCGCGRLGALHFRHVPRLDEKDSWEWNGSKDRPTLRPSVWHRGHWHGYLTDGVWLSV